MSAKKGDLATVNCLMQYKNVDPSACENTAMRWAAVNGHGAVFERLLQDKRVNPSFQENWAFILAVRYGHVSVVEIILQDKRVDPSASANEAIRWAAHDGYLEIVDRLLRDQRVDPSAVNNDAVRSACIKGHFKVVDRLLEHTPKIFEAVLDYSCPTEKLVYFEYRERFTEICIALQDINLPAWITMLILKASFPWTTLPIHKRWQLVCTVKHFHKK